MTADIEGEPPTGRVNLPKCIFYSITCRVVQTKASQMQSPQATWRQYGLGAYVLHTFALTFLIASLAIWLVGVETKGRVLEQITGPAKTA